MVGEGGGCRGWPHRPVLCDLGCAVLSLQLAACIAFSDLRLINEGFRQANRVDSLKFVSTVLGTSSEHAFHAIRENKLIAPSLPSFHGRKSVTWLI